LKGFSLKLAGVTVCALALIAPVVPAAADPPPPPTRQDVPVPVTVQVLRPGTAPGLVFLTPQTLRGAYQHGPQIMDNQGRLVWFRELPEGAEFATDFQVQTYRGQQVLTWWEGGADDTGKGDGVGYIADRNYRIIAAIRSAEPLDLHEFRLTPQGTVIVMQNRVLPFDLTPYGGPANGTLTDNGLQEIDVATGAVVREWWGLDHVPVSDTDVAVTHDTLDYFHMNAVALDTDGDFLVSARHTNTVYKVDRRTGAIEWRLGGRKSDFRFTGGVPFTWQHDAEAAGRNLYRVFDNATSGQDPALESRVVWVRVDPKRHTATVVRSLEHPDALSVAVEGGSEALPRGNTMVSWGSAGHISEFTADGSLVFDATLPARHSSYRAYRFPWHGRPLTDPQVTVPADGATVHAVWNGATGVARWRVLGGTSDTGLVPIADAEWNGLDTAITLPDTAAGLSHFRVQALDARNRVLGTSPVGSRA
jgi:hypothetical protein